MRSTGGAVVVLVAACLAPAVVRAQGSTYALRFHGHGVGDIDRVKIRIDAPAVPADIGVGAFTLEFWMKATPGANGAGTCLAGNDGWINGNIIFDRDVYGSGDFGDYGISLFADGLAFGVYGSSGDGLCGATDVADGQWHHVAVTRSAAGAMELYVDGQQDGSVAGPGGDASYRNGRPTPTRTATPSW